ncbi:hypothetical protein AYO20_00653 [Fonsecaea nubica]|uniref:Uncharacterized protein n=1 Tax=Fonsecaea nubica TaxID=856822 RepID=A0A178DG92_9EURO|nr:hypothetical protein AYO20_00653 [Fonsecaea nubica]OAL40233.1 hypothetical protein AYO20_00653 [Fonsecaea nubica]
MSISDWLDDTKNPTLWIVAIYPLLIFLLSFVCYNRVTSLVQSQPLAPDEALKKIEESERPSTDDTTMEYDLISPASADSSMRKADSTDLAGVTIELPNPRHSFPDEESTTHHNVKHEPKTASPHFHREFLKGILLYCLQFFLAHRVGVLVAWQVKEKHRLLDILVGFLAMLAVSVMLLMTQANLIHARLVTLRGYRPRQAHALLSDPKDSWERRLTFAWFSLLVPWLRLLYGVYIWWSVSEKTGC